MTWRSSAGDLRATWRACAWPRAGEAAWSSERDELGGTCLNWGCIPSKSLIAAAEVYRNIKNADAYGIEVTGEVRADLAAMVARKDKIVAGLVRGIGGLFKAHGVDHMAGDAEILDMGRISVRGKDGTHEILSADKIIIATGSRPAQIPAFPIDGKKIISSEQAVHLKKLPERGCSSSAQALSGVSSPVCIESWAPRSPWWNYSTASCRLGMRTFPSSWRVNSENRKIKVRLGEKITSSLAQGQGDGRRNRGFGR